MRVFLRVFCVFSSVSFSSPNSTGFFVNCDVFIDFAFCLQVTGAREKETQAINASLSALGDVVASMAGGDSHVPYRNSKLTHLLQRPLGATDSKVPSILQIISLHTCLHTFAD